MHRDILDQLQFRYSVSDDKIDDEWNRIKTALDVVDGDLQRSAARVDQELGQKMAAIFEAHRVLLRDPSLVSEFERELHERRVNAEDIVKSVLSRYELRLRADENTALSERGDDIADLSRRLLRVLTGTREHTITQCPPGCVLVTRQLLPSECVHLKRRGIAGVVIERGGATSHAALLTREMGVPAVSGVAGATDLILNGEQLLVDGNAGTVTVRASAESIAEFDGRLCEQNKVQAVHLSHCHDPAVTQDGQVIQVMANVGCEADVQLAVKNGADGIGLYRIEYHFLMMSTLPSEDELYHELRNALKPAMGLDVTVRLLDTGGDKCMPWLDLPHEPDPFLGRRGARFLLAWPELLRTQLRVLLRLSGETSLGILIPMVTRADEVQQVRSALTQEAEKMNIACPRLGVMIETPAAALCVSQIALLCDFLSIGSNDLTQYTMVAGRENPLVADYFDDEHPAVMRLIRIICHESRGLPVSVCGELAASPTAVEELVHKGVTILSVVPPLVPRVKDQVRAIAQHRTP
ncbi:MAG: phosphoenolpyruvate--protein phosphotransferase [Planctomycetales bacterium]|nr:phosphoenolpyruvate--protein phosphotransferase [Planctomycetales bacterium]